MKYIKIIPLSAFGANFNYSIWYVEMRGIKQENVIQRVCSEYENVSILQVNTHCTTNYFD